MEAHGRSFSFIKNDAYYDIPFFQRGYVWDYDNWEDLLDDLIDAEKGYFLGSIILKANGLVSGEFPHFLIIDGQQRLTTLSVLLQACYDTLMARSEEYHYDKKLIDVLGLQREERLFVCIDQFNGVREVKIQHSHIDRPSYEKVINGEYSSQEKLNEIITRTENKREPKAVKETKDRILLCYKFFRNALEEKNKQDIEHLWKLLTSDSVKMLVNIDLGADENEQAIFDTVNSTGVRLTSSDTIKNAIFQRYIELLKDEGIKQSEAEEKAVSLYNRYWVKTFLNDVEDTQYWSKPHASGRLTRQNIELLLHGVAVIDGFYDPNEMKMEVLPQCYKAYISKMSSTELQKFVDQISNYANLYREHISNDDTTELFSYNDYFGRIIQISEALEITTFYPYLLNLLYRRYITNALKEEAFKKRCEELERYLILHAICKASTKNYNKECLQMLKEEQSIQNMLDAAIDIDKKSFHDGLRRIDRNRIATLLLFWIELYRRANTKADLKDLKYNFSLEHIMPQKWSEYWGLNALPVYDEENKVVIEPARAKEIRSAAVYEIGNMTLLNSRLNTSLRNYGFKKKIEGDGKKRGIKQLADCLVTKEIIDLEKWDEVSIRARTASLENEIMKVWNISFSE